MKKIKICLFLALCLISFSTVANAKIQMIGAESDLSFGRHNQIDKDVNAGKKKCSDKGYLDSQPAGQSCTLISYAGNQCYINCKSDSCPSGSPTSCSNTQIQTSLTYTPSGKACYSCRAKVCSDYPAYKDSAASGETCSPISPYSGLNCVYQCKSDKCTTGTLDACTENQIQVSTTLSESGKTCYNCLDKTCSDGGYLDSVPSGQTCTSTIYAGKMCQKDCKINDPCASVIAKTCPGSCAEYCGSKCILCAPMTCSMEYPYEYDDGRVCTKWSCGKTNAPGLSACESRCKASAPLCNDCNPSCLRWNESASMPIR